MCDNCINTIEKFKQRVDAGVAILDERYPGWLDTIDLTQFNLGEPAYCVLGQAARAQGSTYEDEIAKLAGWQNLADFVSADGRTNSLVEIGLRYGFAVQYPMGYATATQVWRDAIVALRLARKAVPDNQPLV